MEQENFEQEVKGEPQKHGKRVSRSIRRSVNRRKVSMRERRVSSRREGRRVSRRRERRRVSRRREGRRVSRTRERGRGRRRVSRRRKRGG